jgi:CheY-like chemotaxis protein
MGPAGNRSLHELSSCYIIAKYTKNRIAESAHLIYTTGQRSAFSVTRNAAHKGSPPFHVPGVSEEGILVRVFLSCRDAAFSETLRNSFRAQSDFVVCGEAGNGVEAIQKVTDLLPDLVVLEIEKPAKDGFEFAETLKLIMPRVPLFLVMEQQSAQAEKEALSHGIDAVFEKAQDLTSLVMNARAICGAD